MLRSAWERSLRFFVSEVGRERVVRGVGGGERELGRLLESLFATIAGSKSSEGGGMRPGCCSLGLVRLLVCWGGCTLHARIFPFGAGQRLLVTGVWGGSFGVLSVPGRQKYTVQV